MSLRRAVLLPAAAVLLVTCGPTRLRVPGALSPTPTPGPEPSLRAGFARVDITPPPGVGLAGNGPEGAEARGYRLRLYARVLVLADSGGNRVAVVVADLPLSSALLHRRVAELTRRTDGIGADRLVIAATHTHAGPGHFFEAAAYNDQGSSVVGFDPVMVDSLTSRIARAIHAAVADLRPARVAWGSRAVWGETRIRSLPAMLRNIPLPTAPADAPAGLPPEYEQRGLYAVDREVRVAGEALPPQHCAVLPKDATVRLETMTGGRVMLFGGASMDGDRHIWWNFVASSRALIDAASERWREQRFPLIPGETEFIPLPERH